MRTGHTIGDALIYMTKIGGCLIAVGAGMLWWNDSRLVTEQRRSLTAQNQVNILERQVAAIRSNCVAWKELPEGEVYIVPRRPGGEP